MSVTTTEIDEYVTAVHAALADLPDGEREDLLDDLPQHLADLQADRGGALVDLIGAPEAYAAELRATAGLAAPTYTRDWWPPLRARLARADVRVGSMLGYARFVDLLRALAPAWWLVRGYLLVELLTAATQQTGTAALIPTVGGNKVVGLALLLVVLAGSVWIGRRGANRRWQRAVVVGLGVALALYGVAVLGRALEPRAYYVDDSTDDGTSGINNIYPVGPDGTVLKNVRLYDQDGNPVVLGNAVCADDGSGAGDGTVQGPGQLIYQTSIPAASASASSADGAALYPLTCAANQGPFGPSSQAQALPSASTSGTPSSTSSGSPSAPSSASPSASASPSR